MKPQGCTVILSFVIILIVCGVEVAAQADPCDDVQLIVQEQVKAVFNRDKTVTPKLIKLLYADCMVNKKSPKNLGLAGFVLIDNIKKAVEAKCPGVVSCTDILVLAVRDAVYLSQGPSYPISLGRRDGMKSDAAWVDLPSPSMSWESTLAYFTSKGLDVTDLVLLLGAHGMGAHGMGRTFCSHILDRLYDFNNTKKPDPTMEPSTLSFLQKQCPKKVKLGQHDPLINLNPQNPTHEFTQSYYSRVLANKSLLGVDQQMLYGGETRDMANRYGTNLMDFMEGFAFSMGKLSGLKVLNGKEGEIRRNCRVVNK